MPLFSGAGHVAQGHAAMTHTAMIFVRGRHKGISHNPPRILTPRLSRRSHSPRPHNQRVTGAAQRLVSGVAGGIEFAASEARLVTTLLIC